MFSVLLLFTFLFAAFASAQNNTLDRSKVDPATRASWCTNQRGSCPMLCGGPQYTIANGCTAADLTYNCTCVNGTSPPDIDQYRNTLPNLECERAFAQCQEANPGQCTNNCGNLQPSDVKAAAGAKPTSSAPASSTAAATSTQGAPVSQTSGPAMQYGPELGFAAVMAGAMGVLL